MKQRWARVKVKTITSQRRQDRVEGRQSPSYTSPGTETQMNEIKSSPLGAHSLVGKSHSHAHYSGMGWRAPYHRPVLCDSDRQHLPRKIVWLLLTTSMKQVRLQRESFQSPTSAEMAQCHLPPPSQSINSVTEIKEKLKSPIVFPNLETN